MKPIFKSPKEEKDFKEFKEDVKKLLSFDYEKGLSSIEKVNLTHLLLFCFRRGDKVKERAKEITADIVNKFLKRCKEFEKERYYHPLNFEAKVRSVYRSILKEPVFFNRGRKKLIQLTEEELYFLFW